MKQKNPILIVGAGPTGLLLACQLARFGIQFDIIDKEPGPVSTSNALAIHAKTLEILAELNLAERFIEQGRIIHAMNLFSNRSKLARITLKDLDTPHPYVLGLPQAQTETLLAEHLVQQGVNIQRSVEVIALRDKTDHTLVSLKKSDGSETQKSYEWILACDGSHSIVRQYLAIPFEGESFTEHFIMMDVEVTGNIKHNEGYAFLSNQGPMAFISTKNFTRIIAEISHDKALQSKSEFSVDDFQQLIFQRVPKSFHLNLNNPVWSSQFKIHRRIAAHYRQHRIFLLGDAAHIHSPVGGQGMNTGMQDAYNLAWKLALWVHGNTSETFLDSYSAERRPVAKDVLARTTAATRMLATHSKLLQFLRNQMLRILLRFNKVRSKLTHELAELDINYRGSPIVAEDCTLPFIGGPKPGERVALRFLNNTNDGKFNLLVFSNEHTALMPLQAHVVGLLAIANITIIADEDELKPVNFAHQMIFDKAGTLKQYFGVSQPCLYLIRPDNYVGYRSQPILFEKLIAYFNKIGVIIS